VAGCRVSGLISLGGRDGVELICGRKANTGGICGGFGAVAIAIVSGLRCLVRVRVQPTSDKSVDADVHGGNGSGSLPTRNRPRPNRTTHHTVFIVLPASSSLR